VHCSCLNFSKWSRQLCICKYKYVNVFVNILNHYSQCDLCFVTFGWFGFSFLFVGNLLSEYEIYGAGMFNVCVYCRIVSARTFKHGGGRVTRVCPCDWSAETGQTLLSQMDTKCFLFFLSLHSFPFSLILFSCFPLANPFKHPHPIHLQRWNEWHDTDSNHQSWVRQTNTLTTRPQPSAAQTISGTSSYFNNGGSAIQIPEVTTHAHHQSVNTTTSCRLYSFPPSQFSGG